MSFLDQHLEFPIFDPAKPVAIIGTGVMGAKVAWVCAKSGLETRVFDIDHASALLAKERALGWSSGVNHELVNNNFLVCESIEEALSGAQLAFENVPEKLALKSQVLKEVSSKLAPEAFMGTNASSITCTPLGEASGRPERFFNLNFSDPLESPMVELMGSPKTAPETIQFAKDWAATIGALCLHVQKEQLGYSFNRLWRVIKKETLRQISEGYTTAEDIDRAWMLSFGTDIGPCGIMDEIGLHTVLSIEEVYFKNTKDISDKPPSFLYDMVEKGLTGRLKGQGFYNYPKPSYREDSFLKGG